MSLTFINDFQNQIYESLSNDQDINAIIKKIYIGSVQDGQSPFLLITITKADYLSIHKVALYAIEFQISVYAKDQNHHVLTILSDLIIKNLSNIKKLFNHYSIDGIKARNIIFDTAKDLVLNRLVIHYKSIIKKEIK